MAKCIGDLLACMPQLEQDRLRHILRNNILALTTKMAQGNPSIFCDVVGLPFNTIHRWSIGQYRLRPDQLFQICSRLRIPAAELFSRDVPNEVAATGFTARRSASLDLEKLKVALLDALTEDPPPSLPALALRLKCKTCAPLQRLAPSICAKIVRRYFSYCPPDSSWVFRGRKCMPHDIEKILRASLAHNPPTPLLHIATELGSVSDSQLRKLFPKLCKAILRKRARHRERRLAKAQAALVSAISEGSPPALTSLARRLGCTTAYISLNFPDLCRRLRDARDAWKVQQRNAIRRRIENAVRQMSGAPVPDVCRAAGVKPTFLLNNFPTVYKQISSAYVARREAARQQRQAVPP